VCLCVFVCVCVCVCVCAETGPDSLCPSLPMGKHVYEVCSTQSIWTLFQNSFNRSLAVINTQDALEPAFM